MFYENVYQRGMLEKYYKIVIDMIHHKNRTPWHLEDIIREIKDLGHLQQCILKFSTEKRIEWQMHNPNGAIWFIIQLFTNPVFFEGKLTDLTERTCYWYLL